MKVGLVTTHFTINYGAVLQGYSLYKAIENLGHDCEVINYSPEGNVYGKKNVYRFNTIKASVSSFLLCSNIKFRRDLMRKRESFSLFVKENFKLSDKKFTTYDDVNKNMANYDALVCGSDQIWNINLMNDPVFFLEFHRRLPDAKYVSYAASIAEKMTNTQYESILNRVNHFDAISIREQRDASILNSMSDKEVVDVLDPVFLQTKSDWLELAENVHVNEPYILCYEMSSDNKFADALKKLRQNLGIKLVCINSKPYNKHGADILLTDVSPQEFVSLISNASFVFTSSFHGVAFSIILEKQFYTMASKFRDSRHRNILNQFSLESRIISDSTIFESKQSLPIIDYSVVSKKVKLLSQRSQNFLKKALEV